MQTRTHLTKELLQRAYVEEGKTAQQIGQETGYAPQTVLKHLYRHGLPTRRTGPQGGSRHPRWKGGVTVDKSGYVLRYRPDHPNANIAGYVREHRLVMEGLLGRLLEPHEVVHHRDGNPANNAPENLELFGSNGTHLAETVAGKRPNWSPEGKARIQAAIDRRKPVLPPPQELLKLYKTQTARQIAAQFGCSDGPVRRALREAGATLLPYRERCAMKWPSPDVVRKLLETMTVPQIAERIGRSWKVLYGWMQRNGVLPPRKAKRAAHATPARSKPSGPSRPAPGGAASSPDSGRSTARLGTDRRTP